MALGLIVGFYSRVFAHYLTKCTPNIVIQMSLSYSYIIYIPYPDTSKALSPKKSHHIPAMLATTNHHGILRYPQLHPTAPPPAGFGNAIIPLGPLGPRPSWGGAGGESLELGTLDGIPWTGSLVWRVVIRDGEWVPSTMNGYKMILNGKLLELTGMATLLQFNNYSSMILCQKLGCKSVVSLFWTDQSFGAASRSSAWNLHLCNYGSMDLVADTIPSSL